MKTSRIFGSAHQLRRVLFASAIAASLPGLAMFTAARSAKEPSQAVPQQAAQPPHPPHPPHPPQPPQPPQPPTPPVLPPQTPPGIPPNVAVASVPRDPFTSSVVRGDPNDLIVLTGEQLLGAKVQYKKVDVLNNLAAPGLSPNTAPTPDSGFMEIVQQSTDRLTLRLPQVMEKGAMYALWVDYGNGVDPRPYLLNDARPLWFSPPYMYNRLSNAPDSLASGVPHTLKVIGRNLRPMPGRVTNVRLEEIANPANRLTLAASINGLDPNNELGDYVAAIEVPDTMPTGSYNIYVSRDSVPGDPTSGNYVQWRPQEFHQGGTVVPQSGPFEIRPDPDSPNHVFIDIQQALPGCSPNDDNDDSWCIARAIRMANGNAGGTVYFRKEQDSEDVPDSQKKGWLIKGLYTKNEDGHIDNIDNCTDCSMTNLLENYDYKWRCLLSHTWQNGACSSIAKKTTYVDPAEGIIVPEGVHLIGEVGAVIRIDADFRPRNRTRLFTVYRNSQIRNIKFTASIDSPDRYTIDADLSPDCDPADLNTPCAVREVDQGALIGLGCSLNGLTSGNGAPAELLQACAAPVENIVIAGNEFIGGAHGILATGKPIKNLFIHDNTFAARKISIDLEGSKSFEPSRFQVKDSLISGNTFYAGSYFHSDKRPTATSGGGPIASNIHGAERLDFSGNHVMGEPGGPGYDHGPPAEIDQYDKAETRKGFRAGFFFALQSNLEQVLVSQNDGYCTGSKIGDGEFIVVDNNNNSHAFQIDYHVPNAPIYCDATTSCPGSSQCRVDHTCDCMQTNKCGDKGSCVSGTCVAAGRYMHPVAVQSASINVNDPYIEVSTAISNRPWLDSAETITDPLAFFSQGHYVVVTSGPGAGQVRRIRNIAQGNTPGQLKVSLDKAFVIPLIEDESHVAILSGTWHFYQVANLSDQRDCRVKPQPNDQLPDAGPDAAPCSSGPEPNNYKGLRSAGVLAFASAAFHSVITGNEMHKSGGIAAWQDDSQGMLQYFDEYRRNLVHGEFDFEHPCSQGGIYTVYAGRQPTAVYPSPDPAYVPAATGIAVDTSKNKIEHANGWRGGAISMSQTGPYTNGNPSFNLNPMIHQNTISDLPVFTATQNDSCYELCGEDKNPWVDRATTCISISPYPSQDWAGNAVLHSNQCLDAGPSLGQNEVVDAVDSRFFPGKIFEFANAEAVGNGATSDLGPISFASADFPNQPISKAEVLVEFAFSPSGSCNVNDSSFSIDATKLPLLSLVAPDGSTRALSQGGGNAVTDETFKTIIFDDSQGTWGKMPTSPSSQGYNSKNASLAALPGTFGDWKLRVHNGTGVTVCVKRFGLLFRNPMPLP